MGSKDKMQDQQYDVSPEMLKLFHRKEKERMASKKYYQNLISNPYRPINDGYPADPNLYRYHAMSTYHSEIWKPSTKSKIMGFFYVTPIILYYLYLSNEREKREKAIRSGVLNYSNRPFPNVY